MSNKVRRQGLHVRSLYDLARYHSNLNCSGSGTTRTLTSQTPVKRIYMSYSQGSCKTQLCAVGSTMCYRLYYVLCSRAPSVQSEIVRTGRESGRAVPRQPSIRYLFYFSNIFGQTQYQNSDSQALSEYVCDYLIFQYIYRVGQKNRTVFWKFETPVYVDIEQCSIHQTVPYFIRSNTGILYVTVFNPFSPAFFRLQQNESTKSFRTILV